MKSLLIILLVTVIALPIIVGAYLSAPKYRGPVSDHFDGDRFHNQIVRDQGFFDLATWLVTRKPGAWSNDQRNRDFPPPPARVSDGIHVTFINHSTLLVQVNGVNILTDPIWSERCSPVSFIGPKRARPPGLRFEDLPPIDVVLISHNHYDHLDMPTIKRLHDAHKPRFFAGLGNRVLLEQNGVQNATELDWWQSISLASGIQIAFVPAQHFSSRGLFDRNGTLWGGFVVVAPHGKIFFAGDTGLSPHFQQIKERFGAMDVSLLPVGAFIPRSFMGHVHMSPADAVIAAQTLGSKHSVGIHFGTFKLADDGEKDPYLALHKALVGLKQPPDFAMLDFGEGRRYQVARDN